MIKLPSELLKNFMQDVFICAGVPEKDAEVCADVLITADLHGIDSHGINRLKPIYIDRINADTLNTKTNFVIVKETITTAVVDGHNGMGHAIAKKCMQMAIDKAKATGMGMVVARNSTHYGIAGYYALMAAKEGLIGITGTNARPSIAPTFGVEPMLGTNPLTFGIPTDEEFPFLLDCATSVTQRGKIEYLNRAGKTVPEGLVIDNKGEYLSDSSLILKALVTGDAALVPLGGKGEDTGGYKGYGYATVVEILSSALQAGNFMKSLAGVKDGKKVPIELGHFFMAISIEAFTELENFKKQTGDILRILRTSKKSEPGARIYTAGEKEYETYKVRSREGIPIPESVKKDLDSLKTMYNLNQYKFPWEGK